MFILFIIFAVFCAVIYNFNSYKYLQTIQLGGYTSQRFIKRVFFKDISYVLNLFFLACTLLLFFLNLKISSVVFLSLYNILLLVHILKSAKKTPLKFTKRLIRQFVLQFTVLLILNLIFVFCKLEFLIFVNFALLPFISLACLYLIMPLENLFREKFKKRAAQKLDSFKNLIKIGITGSFGKTSVKNYLHKMLSEKYNVVSTPKSFNTPMGVSLTVFKEINAFTEIFICEMGARKKGDIKELCQMVKPDIGLINTVGNQHLETFKTQENINAEKMELANFCKSKSGPVFFSSANLNTENLYQNFSGVKYKCNKCAFEPLTNSSEEKNDTFAYAEVLEQTNLGSKFILYINGENIECQTLLLGTHNINNIVLAAALCYKLDVKLSDIKDAIYNLEPVPHRLAVIKGQNSVTVIDDTFNSNESGFIYALEVLKNFPARRILVTPGVVELKKRQYKTNFDFCAPIKGIIDFTVIVGKENRKAFLDGFDFFGYKNFCAVNTLAQGSNFLKTYLKPGDTVLFENDLPDNYS